MNRRKNIKSYPGVMDIPRIPAQAISQEGA
jgi:hypothetical protein